MLHSTSYLDFFKIFLENNQPFLLISEGSDLKRASFLNEVVESLEQEKDSSYFRLNPETSLESLIHQITDRFVIPVRSVNVSLLKQLEDQADILKQMRQKIVLLFEDAHFILSSNLLVLLKLANYGLQQEGSPSIRIVLLGKPALEKKITQLEDFPKDLLQVFSLSPLLEASEEPAKLDYPFQSKIKPGISWIYARRIRMTSIFLLFLLSIFLSRFNWGQNKPFIQQAKTEKFPSKPVSNSAESIAQNRSVTSSDFKDFTSYLKSIEQQLRYDEGVNIKNKSTPVANENLPRLPLPEPTLRSSK